MLKIRTRGKGKTRKRKPGMRGVASLIVTLFIIFAALVAYAVVMNRGYSWGNELERRATVQTSIYLGINSLRAAEAYLETSFNYSIYQGFYENLNKAGRPVDTDEDGTGIYRGGILHGYWYKNDDLVPDEEDSMVPEEDEILAALENDIEQNLLVYTSDDYHFLAGFDVSLPNYNVRLEKADDKPMTIDADPEGVRLVVEKTNVFDEKVKLEKNLEMERFLNSMGSEYLGLYEKAKSRHTEIVKKLEEYAAKLISDYGLSGEELRRTVILDSGDDCEARRKELSDSFESFIAEMESDGGLIFKETDEGLIIKTSLLDKDMEISEIIDKGVREGKTECKFDYNINIIVRLEVKKQGSEQLPVFTGIYTAFDSLKMVVLEKMGDKEPKSEPPKPIESGGLIVSPAEFGKISIGSGAISSGYCAWRGGTRKYHFGYDYPVPGGTAVRAIYPGEVVGMISNWGGKGDAVWIKSVLPNGIAFGVSYGHIDIDEDIYKGKDVNANEQIGAVYSYYNSHLDVKMFWLPDAVVSGKQVWWKHAFRTDKPVECFHDMCTSVDGEPVISDYPLPGCTSA